MNNSYVADTMAVVLRLENRKLSSKVNSILESIELGEASLFIPAMVLAEIGYLSEKKKIDTNLQEVEHYCRKYSTVSIEPITEISIHSSFQIDDIPELHDRIIAEVAFTKDLILITNDPVIIDSKFVSTIW